MGAAGINIHFKAFDWAKAYADKHFTCAAAAAKIVAEREKMIPKLVYTLTTDTKEQGIIEQKLLCGHDTLMSWVIDTRDRAIIKALIELGWSPPTE